MAISAGELPPLIGRWLETYNSGDLAGHIDLYTDDASIVVPGTADTQIDLNPSNDKVVFWEIERALDRAAPRRELEVDWCAVDGNQTCIEATLHLDREHRDQGIPLAVHFSASPDGTTLNRDRTYIDATSLQQAIAVDSPEAVMRNYFATNGPTFEKFLDDTRRWLADDVVWTDRGNPHGLHGLDAILGELERAHAAGVEYMSFEILELCASGDTVLTRRSDRVHGADGMVITALDMMGINTVRDGRIVSGKDYHFDVAAYDANWLAEAERR